MPDIFCLPLVVLYVICPGPALSEWQNTETAFEPRLGASHRLCPFLLQGPRSGNVL